MNQTFRITCPDADLPKEKRISMIYEHFKTWIYSDALTQLILIYNDKIAPPSNLTFKQYLSWLHEFADQHWNYRKKQKEAQTKEGEAARWLLKNDALAETNKSAIYDSSEKLGLIGLKDSFILEPDYILPLGGARMSNLRRVELAKQIIDAQNVSAKIVALSTFRPISESERDAINSYALNAQYEFDAIVSGINATFLLDNNYRMSSSTYENPNQNYAICTFDATYKGNTFLAIAAPSTQPETRRANSADCFEFFFQELKVPEGSKIINCTSQIYCTYQQVRALHLAIQYNVVFDTVGFPFYLNELSPTDETLLSKPVNYLQEIKATIDAMWDFINTYNI